MKLYTLDKIKRDINQNGLYDIFNTKISGKSYTRYFWHVVTREESMRIDLICKNVYGTVDYVDEILTINNIVDPFSIDIGAELLMFYPEDSISLYVQDVDMKNQQDLVDNSKEYKNDPSRQKTRKLPANLKRDPNKKDLNISNGKVKIVNDF